MMLVMLLALISQSISFKGWPFPVLGFHIWMASAQQGLWEPELQIPPAWGTLSQHTPGGFGCQPALLILNIPNQGRD